MARPIAEGIVICAERRELKGALIAFACIVGPFWLFCQGCKTVPKEQAIQVTLSVSAYAAELKGCLEKARPSGQFAVYEACARTVDEKYGRKP